MRAPGFIAALCGVAFFSSVQAETLTYPIVDTGQSTFYGISAAISEPAPGANFYGQDAQYDGNAPSYQLSGDGKTVTDLVTGLMWQSTPDANGDGAITADDKYGPSDAPAYVAAVNQAQYGGYSDWRLPTIKELYSLILFIGTDPSGEETLSDSFIPFIDTSVFEFAYGDEDAGERIIDVQYLSSTFYVSTTMVDAPTVFGVNFADGRIKGYGYTNGAGEEKTFIVLCVRGGDSYGVNRFGPATAGTVVDSATGLMWSQEDSKGGMDWQAALAWVQARNAETYLGYSDWRLPNAKELESIVDYTRSPATTGTPAIDPVFLSTEIENEAGETDWPFYWSGTTHINTGTTGGENAAYVSFGRALGYFADAWRDVHGAGAQRSDPKIGDPENYPYGHGPQGDAIRIYNYVRLVRDADLGGSPVGIDTESSASIQRFSLSANAPNPFNPRTALRFSLTEADAVRLAIYDASGRFVRTLVDGHMNAGAHEAVWDGRDNSGHAVASGVYFYRLESGDVAETRRMTLVR